ncbi:MAG TPA: molybdopterin-dependent oxidoreductase, partial [Solirubrobacteraceae bacterium]|nr:molybdopterin-dependent oxidoreductase [Solirubrobacteraceae bacterium]
GIPLVAVTGLLSQIAYDPGLGRNDPAGAGGVFALPLFRWPTSPPWLYAATQGVHVTVGIALVPVLLAKLWSVIPKLFAWPPVTSPAQALERISLALLVGGALFEFATGILNVQLWYPWHFGFVRAHYFGAWVFLAAFLFHVLVKVPVMARALRTRQAVLAPHPPEGTMSRRGLFALVGAGSATLLVVTAGQSIGGPLRRLALLAPHGQVSGAGPNGFQVNKTAASVGILPEQTGRRWRLELRGPSGRRRLTRAHLAALPQHTYDLPIACVEGWSTTQRWTGVRLRDLAALVGGAAQDVDVRSLQRAGAFAQATLAANQVGDERSLLALRVNGADLSLDHGYPARVIVPALPGVHNTKWVAALTFRA